MPVAGDRGARGGSRCGREHTDRKYRTELERAPIQWVVPGAARCLLLPTGREEVLDRLGATEIIALCGWPGAQRPATTGEREPAVTEAPLVPPPPHDVSQHLQHGDERSGDEDGANRGGRIRWHYCSDHGCDQAPTDAGGEQREGRGKVLDDHPAAGEGHGAGLQVETVHVPGDLTQQRVHTATRCRGGSH